MSTVETVSYFVGSYIGGLIGAYALFFLVMVLSKRTLRVDKFRGKKTNLFLHGYAFANAVASLAV